MVSSVAALPAAAAAAVAAVGCGGTTHYTLEPTRQCLMQEPGLVVRHAPRKDFVASTALEGAMNVKFPDNQVTLAFGEDAAEAARLGKAYRRFKGKNIGIESALEEVKNVVLLWAISPPPAYRATIVDCLEE